MGELRNIESTKAIEYRISELCQDMSDFWEGYQRANKTSLVPHRADRTADMRYACWYRRQSLRSQGGQRFLFNNARKEEPDVAQSLEPINLESVAKSYRLREEGPVIRMKWKSVVEEAVKEKATQDQSVDSNNLDLLAYTIPELENSISRLTQSRNIRLRKEALAAAATQNNKARTDRPSQSVTDNRDWKKKYHIPRLF